jgi:folate-binding protein YgfZ
MKQRVLLQGKPGLELLHRISSADILGLVRDRKVPGLILTPQGKIVSYFEVTRKEEDSIELEFEDDFLAQLEHYTFSERYQIRELPPSNEAPSTELERIRGLIPKEGSEFKADGTTNPLEVNLRVAIADQKGCYPGQEVIEKIISLGSPAKKLCLAKRLSGTEDPMVPAPVSGQDGTEAGLLTSVSLGEGLVILKRTHCKAGQRILISNQEWLVEKVAE